MPVTGIEPWMPTSESFNERLKINLEDDQIKITRSRLCEMAVLVLCKLKI